MNLHHWLGRIYPHLLVYETSRRWFKDFATYHHGMTWWEFWVNYTLARQCFNDVVETDGEYEAFFTEWPLYRQAWRNRNRTWYDVLGYMTRKDGRLLDYGCGNGDMLMWLRKRRPGWYYTGIDLKDTPHFLYAQERPCPTHPYYFRPLYWHELSQRTTYDVIVCQETLEHLENPVDTISGLKKKLAPGGMLIWDYINDGQGRDRGVTLLALKAKVEETAGVFCDHS